MPAFLAERLCLTEVSCSSFEADASKFSRRRSLKIFTWPERHSLSTRKAAKPLKP
jgi:hypothetical protein